MTGPRPTLQCPCDGRYLTEAFRYDAPPAGETKFNSGPVYRRAYDRCDLCGHWFSRLDMELVDLYGGAYVNATYGERMRATYDRIMALPPERSDNTQRVARVVAFAKANLPGKVAPRLLDVGSGLAVFPARMREAGWDCTALDPDARAAEHARAVAGVSAHTGDFLTLDRGRLGSFDAITFNKMLEHVDNPIAFLRAAAPLLEPSGFFYVEVPDGEAAARQGAGREEFFIEHNHVFSPASLAMTAARAGLNLVTLDRLHEPSNKYTLFAFLTAGS